MMRFVKVGLVLTAVALTSACTRIETGEVGVRVGFDKQVQTIVVPSNFTALMMNK
jgi:hypothetical protein